MKNKSLQESLFTFINGVFYGTLITFAALCAFATAFSFHEPDIHNHFYIPVEISYLFVISLCLSAIFSLLFTFKRLWILAVILFFSLLGLQWHYGSLRHSTYDLFYIISRRYDSAYDCGVIFLNDKKPQYAEIAVAFRGMATIGAMLITWATCKRQSSYWVLFFSLLCFVPCCTMTNTIPATWTLFLWGLSLLLFMMTNYTRKSQQSKSTLLCLAYIPPLAVALFLLFTLVPQDTYNGEDRADDLLMKVEDYLGLTISDADNSGTKEQNQVDLSSMEDRKERNIPVMYITAPNSTTYYLRGEVFNTYTGTSWIAEDNLDSLPWSNGYPTENKISIRTRFDHDMLYVPYCADPAILSEGDMILKNAERLKEYSYLCYESTPVNSSSVSRSSMDAWTQLPTSTQAWAEVLLFNEFYMDGNVYNIIDFENDPPSKIADYVRSSAEYSLKPKQMDPAYGDFAKWFVEEGESGYCVHFATTAVVLLRAAGIPARYVTGYAIDTVAGKQTTVYQRNSHAWAEYWTDDLGWQVLEATPSTARSEEITSEIETEGTTLPPEPTETTTAPTETEELPTETLPKPTKPVETVASTDAEREVEVGASVGSDRSDSFPKLWSILVQLLKWLLIIAVPVAVAICQRKLRLFLWKRKLESSSTNEQTLLYWNRSLRYYDVLKKKPDPKLRKLAERAKFSHHEITLTELGTFRLEISKLQKELKKLSFFRRFYAKWVLAL